MNEGILFEYEQILLGNKNFFSAYYFDNGDEYNKNAALTVIRYACEYYLKWEPEDVYQYLNAEIINRMKLKNLIGYLCWPPELNPKTDFYYIASLLYPHLYPLSTKEFTLRTYKNILEGKLAKFPKEYLSESQGFLRACICFQYMVSQYMQFENVRDMYICFSSVEGIRALKKYHLFAICNDLFPEPIDFLHASLSQSQKNEFFYYYYKFIHADNAQIRRLKKSQKFIM